tara:strand:- start:196 stop:1893 length:1698 start_codon:yes stop_codon:yes gene_type:complete
MQKYYNYIFIFLIPLTAIFFSVSNYTIQVAVDPALIINGDIQIPDKNAELYIFLKKQFSSTIQFSSFLLKMGLNIFQISKVLISITYLSFFLGVYLCIKSLISNIFTDINSKILSYIITFIIVIIAQLELGQGDYPVHYLSEHTYGLYGLAISTLLFGLVANGNFKFVFFLSTFFVAIHGAHGIWFCGILLLTIFIDRFLKKNFYKPREIIIGSLIGTLFFIISFFYNYISFGPTEYFTIVESDLEIIENWIKYWEDHRATGEFNSIYLIKSFLFFLFLLISLKFTNKYLNRNTKYLLILISVSIFFSSIIYILYKIFFDYVPMFLMVPMPTRFLNVHSIIAWPVIFALFIVYTKLISEKFKINLNKCYFGFLFFLFLINISNLNSYRKYFFYHYDQSIGIKSLLKNNPFRTRIAQFYTMFFYDPKEKLEDYAFWEHVKKVDKGYNWLASPFLADKLLRYGNQLYLFHPRYFDAVLIDQTTGRRTKKIIEEIFDLPFNNPLGNGKKFTKFNKVEHVKKAYQNKDLDDWRTILSEFHVKYVVVPINWKINLPLKLKGNNVAMYVIE